MSKNRYPSVKVRDDGTKGCRGCGKDIPGTHRTWCSNPCREAHHLRYIKKAVLKRDGDYCYFCGASGKTTSLEFDHIIPFSEGGETKVYNMRALCRACHTRRTAEWRSSKSSLSGNR